LKGFHIGNEEVSDEMMYWFFAHCFGYTPEQVDNLPYDRLVYFTELEREAKKKEGLTIK